MRIIGGEARGRRLFAPSVQGLRPTADLVREALFQILTNRIPTPWTEIRVLDLFAGTGALGLEALSRGARESVFVDLSRGAIDAIARNIKACGFSSRAMVIKADASQRPAMISRLARENGLFDIIVADPPYMEGLSQKCLMWVAQEGVLRHDGIMAIEEFKKVELPQSADLGHTDTLELADTRTYGQTRIWFYKRG